MTNKMSFEKTPSSNGKIIEKEKELRIKLKNFPSEKCELVGFDSLPEYLKDNDFILRYYRCEWPLKQTILSIFSIHNETLNIWTHLIGFFIFLVLTIFAASTIFRANIASLDLPHIGYTITFMYSPQITNHTYETTLSPQPDQDTVTRWPFFAFLFGAMTCLLTSSMCHLLACHSEQCAYKMLRLDYTGISTLIVTSFYPVVYYTFIHEPFLVYLYIGFITLFGLATVLVSLVPVFQTVEFRPTRTLLFACMSVSGLVPIMHKVLIYGDRLEAMITMRYEMAMLLLYGVGVVIYATRVPERWMPGKFDIVGHSHQLFHVFVVGGAYIQYLAGLEYLKWRDFEGCLRL